MKISVGDISAQAKDVNQALAIIKQYETAMIAENRVVSYYLVDGLEVGDIEAYLKGKDGHEIQDIVLVTRTPQELVRDSIVSFLDYVPALKAGLMTVKEKLTIGDLISEDTWMPLLDGLDWTNQLLQGLKGLIEYERDILEGIANRWHEQLSEMLSAWESGDTVFFGGYFRMSLLQNSPFVEKENKLPYCRKAQFSKNTLAGSSNIGINRF